MQMLKLLLILALNSFQIENNQIIWQRVYDTELNGNEIYQAIIESGNFQNIEYSDNKIIAELKPLNMQYAAAGYSYMKTAMYISMYNYIGFMVIDIKENKYRVTIKKIRVNGFNDVKINTLPDDCSLEYFALKNGNFRPAFIKNDAPIFEYTFNKLCTFRKVKDW